MRVMILGGDGYLGWPTAMAFASAGHDVCAVDNYLRRTIARETNSEALMANPLLPERAGLFERLTGRRMEIAVGDCCDFAFLSDLLRTFQPEAVVHYAEQPSAPYSMIGYEEARTTLANNLMATFNVIWAVLEQAPACHIVKLGTMGEYGEPNIDIEEGWIEIEHKGRKDRVLFPKRPGSYYHLSKVHDSHNIEFACRIWGLRATDLNQGIVYGQQTPETSRDDRLATRYDYDAVFGTVLNRFVIQSVLGEPLTIYGSGSQVRGIIEIRDTVSCLELACENPAERGEFRVFNQMTQSLSITQMAETIARVSPEKVTIEHLANPRVEEEGHHYNVVHSGMVELGLEPHLLSDTLIESLFEITKRFAHRVRTEAMIPTIDWRRAANTIGL